MAWNGTYAQDGAKSILNNTGTSELDSAIKGLNAVMQSQLANQLMQEKAGESLKSGLQSLVDDFGKPMQELEIAETQQAEREKSRQLEQEQINQSAQDANNTLMKSMDGFIKEDAKNKLGVELENAITGGQSVSNLRKAIDFSVDNAELKGTTYQKPKRDANGNIVGYVPATLVGNELEGFNKDLIREYVLYDDKFLAAQRFMTPEQIAAITKLRQNGSLVNAIKTEREANITQEMLDRGQLTPEMYRREAEIIKEENPFHFRNQTVDAIQANLSLGQDLLSGRFDGKSYKSYEQQRLDMEKALYGQSSLGNTVPAPKEENDEVNNRLNNIEKSIIKMSQQSQQQQQTNVSQGNNSTTSTQQANNTTVTQPEDNNTPAADTEGNISDDNFEVKTDENGVSYQDLSDKGKQSATDNKLNLNNSLTNIRNALANINIANLSPDIEKQPFAASLKTREEIAKRNAEKTKYINETKSLYTDKVKSLDSTLNNYSEELYNGRAKNKIIGVAKDGKTQFIDEGFRDFLNDTTDEQLNESGKYYSAIANSSASDSVKDVAIKKLQVIENIKVAKQSLVNLENLDVGIKSVKDLGNTVDNCTKNIVTARANAKEIGQNQIDISTKDPNNRGLDNAAESQQQIATEKAKAKTASDGLNAAVTAGSQKTLENNSALAQAYLMNTGQQQAVIGGEEYTQKDNPYVNTAHANLFILFDHILADTGANKTDLMNHIKTNADLKKLLQEYYAGIHTKDGYNKTNAIVSKIIANIQNAAKKNPPQLKGPNQNTLNLSNADYHNKINKLLLFGAKKATDNTFRNDRFKSEEGQHNLTFGQYSLYLYKTIRDISDSINRF
jgi:hypothetical protein